MRAGALGYIGGPGGLEKLRECVRRVGVSRARGASLCGFCLQGDVGALWRPAGVWGGVRGLGAV